ncbi:MAG: asparaginase [Gemmatimonadota bacterium]
MTSNGISLMEWTGRPPGTVAVLRGGQVESVHRVHVAVTASHGDAWVGEPSTLVSIRSAAKPFQAVPVWADGVVERFHLDPFEVALCCASHSGEPLHVETVRSLLARGGLGEEVLACGPRAPFHGPSARRLMEKGEKPTRVHNNCSGKHAGMLLLAVHRGWPTHGYHEQDHPVQMRIVEAVSELMEVDPHGLPMAVDGCGVPCFFVPLRTLATGCRRLTAQPGGGFPGYQGLLQAMGRNPWWVAGTQRFCTRVMEASEGRVVVKVGAEGVYGAAVPDMGWGIALKAEDGAGRAAEAALVAVLRDLLPELSHSLESVGPAALRNTRDEEVGHLEVRLPWAGEGELAHLGSLAAAGGGA